MSTKSLLAVSALGNVVLAAALVAIVIRRDQRVSAPEVSQRPTLAAPVESATAESAATIAEVPEAERQESPATRSNETARPDDASDQPKRQQIDEKRLRSLAQRLATGLGMSELPSDELRDEVEAALADSDADLKAAQEEVVRVTSYRVDRKIQDGDFSEAKMGQLPGKDLSHDGEGTSCSRPLPNGNIAHVIIRPGEFDDYDDAQRKCREVEAERRQAVRTVLEAWNEKAAKGQ